MRSRLRRTALCACAIVLLSGPLGCVLLRSSPRQPEEWTLIAFPGARSPEADAPGFATDHTVASSCAEPNIVTLSVEPCYGARVTNPGSGRSLLIIGNSSSDGYRPDVLRAIMSEAGTRARFASQSVTLAREGGHAGMLLDIRLLGPRDVDALVRLVSAVADSARSHGLSALGVVVPVADTAAYPGRHLGALADFLGARLELDPASPGPLTPRDRIAALVGARAAEIGAHRVMLLLPADGYIWPAGEARKRISFEEAVATARDWGVDLERDESSGTLRARAPGRGEIWVNDAVLVDGVVRDARRLGIRKFALYGLGGEDPGIRTAIADRAVRR